MPGQEEHVEVLFILVEERIHLIIIRRIVNGNDLVSYKEKRRQKEWQNQCCCPGLFWNSGKPLRSQIRIRDAKEDKKFLGLTESFEHGNHLIQESEYRVCNSCGGCEC